MSIESNISLIDLNKQLPFEIDEALKKQICFGESLIISCCHYEGVSEEVSIASEWSCQESIESEKHEDVKEKKEFDLKTVISEEVSEEVSEEEDFQFYFFPDCSKATESHGSKASIIIKDGMPKMNPIKQQPKYCLCNKDKKGECKCFIKLPCKCGAKEESKCTCSKLESVCICDEGRPEPVCTCDTKEICSCNPNGKTDVECRCDKVLKPCICHPDKFPSPVCVCEKLIREDSTLNDEQSIKSGEKSDIKNNIDRQRCDCQKPEHNPPCPFMVGKKCACTEDACVCEKQDTCVCAEISEQISNCENNDFQPSCICQNPPECVCDNKFCQCYPVKNHCTCDNPDDCVCFKTCECTEPCLCDININKNICTCVSQASSENITIAQNKDHEAKILKKTRAGKHGYRWCHDVDPRHTYFDFGYGRHDKLRYEEKERKTFKILGRDEGPGKNVSEQEEVKQQSYKKNIRKPSLDCCSAVGGLTINVETLGEDKDKFLVQVVSHSSKNGAKTGSKIVSILDCNLHTLEENRTEYIANKDRIKEKRNYIAICESGYYNKVSRICGDRNVIKRFYHSFEEAKNFLLEGATIVLMRYVGLIRYRGNIKTSTVLIDGIICESIYVCLGVSQAIVNGKPFFVVKVERHIIEPSGCIHQTLTVLSLRGYIISQEWADSNYFLHINPLLKIFPEKDEIEQHEPLRETWRTDLQLLSDYLDFKSTRTSEGARYVSENGELTGTVRDYLQALLLLRPSDVLHFTRHYFGTAFSALDLPHNEFFDSSTRRVKYFFFEE